MPPARSGTRLAVSAAATAGVRMGMRAGRRRPVHGDPGAARPWRRCAGGMLWSHLAKCSLITIKPHYRYLTLVGTLRAMAGHTGRPGGIERYDE